MSRFLYVAYAHVYNILARNIDVQTSIVQYVYIILYRSYVYRRGPRLLFSSLYPIYIYRKHKSTHQASEVLTYTIVHTVSTYLNNST